MRFSHRFFAVAALALVTACSHASDQSATASPAPSDTTASEATPGDGTTITTDKGQVTYGGSVDTSKLGVPIYPGAKQAEGGMSVSSANESGSVAQFKTNDSLDKVYDFYKSQLPSSAENLKMGTQMAMFTLKNADNGDTVVQITAGSGFTAITITHSLKKP